MSVLHRCIYLVEPSTESIAHRPVGRDYYLLLITVKSVCSSSLLSMTTLPYPNILHHCALYRAIYGIPSALYRTVYGISPALYRDGFQLCSHALCRAHTHYIAPSCTISYEWRLFSFARHSHFVDATPPSTPKDVHCAFTGPVGTLAPSSPTQSGTRTGRWSVA